MPQSQKTLEFLQKLKDKGHWNDTYGLTSIVSVLISFVGSMCFK